MPMNSQRERLTTAIWRSVPRRPGVYLFQDGRGRTMYIGKSVNLRQRMLSYFNSDQAGMDGRIRQMRFSIRGFDYRETATELLALLLEDTLIKRELPAYNTRQREYEDYRYLVLTDDAYPTCKVVDQEKAASGTVFGPFRDEYFVADILAVVNRHLHLRSCTDPEPFRKRLNYDLGFCTGP